MVFNILQNIFLFKGCCFEDLEDLNIYSYPSDVININDEEIIVKILDVHKLEGANDYSKEKSVESKIIETIKYKFNEPVPLIINNLNLFTIRINGKYIIGLILDVNDNPFDYKDFLKETLFELLNNHRSNPFETEFEIDNFLIALFIDLRRYGDEVIEKQRKVEFEFQEYFVKAFIYGIDEVGKSSLVRRIKTGEFSENFFTPTRKFNIEYVQDEEKRVLALWDMPGQYSFRKKWLIGLQDSNFLIYMFDVANQLRFEEAKSEFWKIINRYDIVGVPLLILGNKVDLLETESQLGREGLTRLKNELMDYFEFERIENREWQFLLTSVKTNKNMSQVVDFIFSSFDTEKTVL